MVYIFKQITYKIFIRCTACFIPTQAKKIIFGHQTSNQKLLKCFSSKENHTRTNIGQLGVFPISTHIFPSPLINLSIIAIFWFFQGYEQEDVALFLIFFLCIFIDVCQLSVCCMLVNKEKVLHLDHILGFFLCITWYLWSPPRISVGGVT